jgi:hypothetical protein
MPVMTLTDWISMAEAARLAAISKDTLSRLEQRGLLTVRRIPGTRPKYLRSSVEALVA